MTGLRASNHYILLSCVLNDLVSLPRPHFYFLLSFDCLTAQLPEARPQFAAPLTTSENHSISFHHYFLQQLLPT
jgi:hypothetical protein